MAVKSIEISAEEQEDRAGLAKVAKDLLMLAKTRAEREGEDMRIEASFLLQKLNAAVIGVLADGDIGVAEDVVLTLAKHTRMAIAEVYRVHGGMPKLEVN